MNTRFKLSTAAVLVALATGAWAQGSKFAISSYQVEGNTLLPEAKVEQILKGYLGAERSLDDINAAAEALRQAYEDAGYPVIKVFPPQQTAAAGRVTLKVIEGQVQSVKIKGNESYDEANIRSSLPPLQEKSRPNAKQIVAAIAAANENPAKQVAVNFQSAEEVGQIDAVINVTEDRPQKFIAGYDNMGATSTGVNRINFGYQNANLFNLDHMATIQFATSLDYPSKSQQISGGYRIPFYNYGLSFDVIGAYSHSKANTSVGFGSTQFTGEGYMLGLRLNQAMPSAGEYRHRMIYGFDFKDFDNTCTGAAAGTCGTVTTLPLSATYFGAFNAPEVQASAALSFAINVPGGPHGGKQEYALARAGAEPAWNAWRANTNVLVPLPADLQIRGALNGQLSLDRLVPGEQFGLGGSSSVRGYVERTVSGDSGYSGNLEVYSPDFGKLMSTKANARALLFYDFGRVYFHEANKFGERQQPLSSIGAGLRLNLGRDLAVKFDVGFAQEKYIAAPGTGATRQVGDGYGHAAINLQF
jgi:hemolysin activation/secretion protein